MGVVSWNGRGPLYRDLTEIGFTPLMRDSFHTEKNYTGCDFTTMLYITRLRL